MNNNSKSRFKAMTKNDRKQSAKAGFVRKSQHAKVARCK